MAIIDAQFLLIGTFVFCAGGIIVMCIVFFRDTTKFTAARVAKYHSEDELRDLQERRKMSDDLEKRLRRMERENNGERK